MRLTSVAILLPVVLTAMGDWARAADLPGHPRLYCTADDLPRLRGLRDKGVHALIWANLTRSADWCARQQPRTEWIPTAEEDPRFENLYDRFYGAMHDAAIVEHLAFASALSDPDSDPYFEPAKDWVLACARVWRQESGNRPDQNKAYAVLRVMKALAVSYDLLYGRLSTGERDEIRDTLVAVGREYYDFFRDPSAAGEGYNKHHGSVDASPFGVVALSLLGEVPEAGQWLKLMIGKHVDYLLPQALTPSGTNEQSSNFWASTLQYRIFFVDAVRRVTGRDLFAEVPGSLPGRIALAAVVGRHPRDLKYNESHRSVLLGPSYGQLNYWSPVLLYLAREQRRPIYQHLALWDESLGALQRTRYITPNRKEELLFSFGGYAYLWYDPEVPASAEEYVPRTFEFPEPEVNEAYLRDSFEPGGIAVVMKKGGLVIHAGGRPVLVDRLSFSSEMAPARPVDEMLVADDGRWVKMRCVGPQQANIGEQIIELHRPGRLTVRRESYRNMSCWYAGQPERLENTLTWPDGTTLTVTRGSIEAVDPQGYVETKEHFGGMEFADPHPMVYPTLTLGPDRGQIRLEVKTPAAAGSRPRQPDSSPGGSSADEEN